MGAVIDIYNLTLDHPHVTINNLQPTSFEELTSSHIIFSALAQTAPFQITRRRLRDRLISATSQACDYDRNWHLNFLRDDLVVSF